MNAPLIAVTLAVAAVISGAYIGHRLATAGCEQARLASVERAIAQAEAQAAMDADILRAAGERQQAMETRTRTIIKTVVRHVQSPVTGTDYRDCRLDACGLCLARRAADGLDGADCPCASDDPLPAAGKAGHGHDGGAFGGIHREHHAPAVVHGQTPGADRMGEQ